ncbi:MAG: hypothetical protein AB7F78_19810 [Hyphomicrobiaceae bacterium]
MSDLVVRVTDGPDKPALQWALAYPDREKVHFRLEQDGIDAEIARMDELAGGGFSFTLRGIVRSGEHSGRPFHGTYAVETRSGTLTIEA